MAWRCHEHILRGELDNTVRGRVTGRIWLAGLAEPMTPDLRGDCAPDLAGCTLTFDPHDTGQAEAGSQPCPPRFAASP